MVSGGKETFSFEFIRILLAEQRAHAVAARFASSEPVEGLKYGAAAAALRHPIGAEVVLLTGQGAESLRCAAHSWWMRCAGFA